MIRRLLIAGMVAAAFTLTLNFDSIREWSAGRLTVAQLNDQSADELFYFSTIAKVGQGQPPLGHTSYKEHNRDGYIANLSPVIEGLMMRFSGLSFAMTLFAGDLLFPFLAVFVLMLGFLAIFRSPWVAGSAAVMLAGEIGTYWFRASNPQLPFLAVCGWIATVTALPKESRVSLLLRGAILGALTWLQPVYASMFVILDGTLLLAGLIERRSPKKTIGSGLVYSAGVLAIVLPRFIVRPPAEVATDTIYRMGLINTHFPALPRLQAILLCVIAALLLWKKLGKKWPDEHVKTCTILIMGCLLALNQSVILGIDAIFASYYPHSINVLLALTAIMVGIHLLQRTKRGRAAIVAAGIVALAMLRVSVAEFSSNARVAAAAFEQSDMYRVVQWFKDQPGTAVVAAPYGINGRIPYETPHYDLFNAYGWNLPMTDRELAERYALQVRLIPSSKGTDRTYTHVFGGHPGLSAAKVRSFCKLKRSILGTNDPCIVDGASFVIHQDLFPIIDNAQSDVAAALKKFHVDYIVTEAPHRLPAEALRACKKQTTVGAYVIWTCSRHS